MRREAKLLLSDMERFSRSVVMLLGAMTEEEFVSDLRTNEAITSLIIKFGEAATVLMEDYPKLAADYPEIPLISARRMRNKLVHGYWRADLAVVYQTAKQDMPTVTEPLGRALIVAESYELDSGD